MWTVVAKVDENPDDSRDESLEESEKKEEGGGEGEDKQETEGDKDTKEQQEEDKVQCQGHRRGTNLVKVHEKRHFKA